MELIAPACARFLTTRAGCLEQRFVGRVLPLFTRQTAAVGALLPEMSLHWLALSEVAPALHGLLGAAARLSPSSILRVKADWQGQSGTPG